MDGIIEIQFLTGTTNNTFNNKTIDNSNTNSKENFVVHPAFKFGDEELTGIWVAKYEASRTDATDTDVGTSKSISFKNNVLSINNHDIGYTMYLCRKMEQDNIYGWESQKGTLIKTGDILDDSNNFDTHLMKNIEWGAVTYLAQSKYGINGKIEPNTSQISGKGGKNSTTTGNETGIYDMAGQNSEFVSAYYIGNTGNYTFEKFNNMVNFADKYKNKYTTGFSSDKYGDSIFETSSSSGGSNSWYGGSSIAPSSSYPFIYRGGSLKGGNIFSYAFDEGYNSVGKQSFRATIVKDNDILNEEENQEQKQRIEQEQMENTKTSNLTLLLNSLNTNYTKGYMESINTFTYTYKTSDIDFSKIRKYYETFKTDYETFKTNISKYSKLNEELKNIISATDEFITEFDKATTQADNSNTIASYFETSSNKWDISYKLVYKALYEKDLE